MKMDISEKERRELEGLIGKKIKILDMEGEIEYTGRVGVVESVDDAGQLHGTWGGCAVIPGVDSYEEV